MHDDSEKIRSSQWWACQHPERACVALDAIFDDECPDCMLRFREAYEQLKSIDVNILVRDEKRERTLTPTSYLNLLHKESRAHQAAGPGGI